MKVLFLDIDGVCNCAKTFARNNEIFGIDPYMALLVDRIKEATGCEIVLSSSWRHSGEGVDQVESKVGKLYGMTARSGGGMRGSEVRLWLEEHPEVTRHAILDDNSDFFPDQPLFLTTWEEGLTDEIAQAVIKHLNQ